MATHAANFGRASALPLSAVLGAIPSYPRPVIERLVAKLIDHLDGQDGDPDAEADPFNEGEPLFEEIWRAMVNAHPHPAHDPNCDAEEDDPAEDDDPAEEDDHSGGNIEDEGEPEVGIIPVHGVYGADQTKPNYALI